MGGYKCEYKDKKGTGSVCMSYNFLVIRAVTGIAITLVSDFSASSERIPVLFSVFFIKKILRIDS